MPIFLIKENKLKTQRNDTKKFFRKTLKKIKKICKIYLKKH